jgi:signal transduction histidine kinase
VRSGGDNWWARLGAVPYRELLNAPGIARAHDFQRLLSYGLALIVGFVIDLPGWRIAVVAVLSATLLYAAARRFVTHRRPAPFRLALTDLGFASLIVAVATGSPLLTAGVVGVVALILAASFAAPGWWFAAATAAAAVVTVPVAAAIGGGPSGVSDSLVALVLIVLLLSIAMPILVVFTFQAMDLRRALSSREVQLNSVLSVTPVMLATIDGSGMITAIAGDVRGRLGLPGDHVDGSSAIGEIVRAAALGERTISELPMGERIFNVTADPGPDGSVLLTAYDLTEQIDARHRLESLMRSKDQFIAAISHELRTPLAAVLGFAEEVRDEIPGSDPLRPMVEVIADQSAEMAAIIEDLLVVARSSFEGVTLAPRPIQLADEAGAVAETIGPRLLKQPTPHLEPVIAFADPIRVRQIVRNLLTNADRYGGDEIEIHTRSDGGRAVLEIRDSGTALAPELQQRIFEPYESSGPIGGQPAAIGLGLAVSRTLAELMSGTLEYTHRGGWSVFELRLPCVPAQVPA